MVSKKNSNRVKIIIVVFSVLAIIVLGTVSFGSSVLAKNTIYSGVYINNTDISGKTKSEAKKELDNKFQKNIESKVISLKANEYQEDINIKDLDIEYNTEKAVKEAYAIGRKGSKIDRIKEIFNTKSKHKNIEMNLDNKKLNLATYLDEVDTNLNHDPIDAILNFDGANFSVTNEKTGEKVDRKKLEESIEKKIENIEKEKSQTDIEIPIEITEPRLKAESLKKINRVIGTYTTRFSANDTNRNYNIRLSANAVNKKIVLPEEVFSFNDNTGLRDEANGYKESIVIEGNEFVPGIGGGVCQTSTTMYNAVLEAGLQVIERSPHSEPISYVPKGRDAAVSDGLLDFRFKNNTKAPIFISTSTGSNSITMTIYGE